MILTFGTNDLSSSYSASSFASDYAKGIKAVQDAYPSVDIIVNAIPPLGQQHSNQNLTQTQVDEYNKALVQMCQDNGWKFLNSAEVLKDSSTGYAKSGYVLSSDGIHLTEQAMDALFTYIRTHSYITEDTRPALTAVPTHTGDKDVSVGSNIVSSTTAAIAPETTEAPDEDASDSSSSNGPDWADGTSGSYATATPDPEYTYWSEIIAPTCTEQGYTYYHCNEDSSKDYKSEYVNALGHDFQNGYCTRCGAPESNGGSSAVTLTVTGAGAYETSIADGRYVVAVPAETAVLSGCLGNLKELKAQGVNTLVFRTQLRETALDIDSMLSLGVDGTLFTLTHNGEGAELTVGGFAHNELLH